VFSEENNLRYREGLYPVGRLEKRNYELYLHEVILFRSSHHAANNISKKPINCEFVS